MTLVRETTLDRVELRCEVCEVPLRYSGHGRRPRFCGVCARDRKLRMDRERWPSYVQRRWGRSGHLRVTCWCETEIVLATPDEIISGQTHPCGRPGCGP